MFRAALFGAAVTLALIVVPVVHFVTALPSPLIGGYVAGVRMAAEPGEGLLLGALLAGLIVVPLAGLVLLLSLLWLELSAVQYTAGIAAIFFFAAALAGLGAVLGGAHARRQRQP